MESFLVQKRVNIKNSEKKLLRLRLNLSFLIQTCTVELPYVSYSLTYIIFTTLQKIGDKY